MQSKVMQIVVSRIVLMMDIVGARGQQQREIAHKI